MKDTLTADARAEGLRGHAAMLAFSGLVAGSFSLGGMAAPHVDPVALTAVRFGAAAVLVALLLGAQGALRRAYFAAPWRYLVWGGLFAFYFAAMFEGLKTAAPVSTAAVFTLTPLMAAGFGWLILRQVTTPRMALALGLAALGALWVIFDADPARLAAFHVGLGERIFFVGCIAHALYIPMVRLLSRGEPVMVLTLGMLTGGFLFLLALGLPAILSTDWAALPAIVWVTLAYLTVVSGIVTFWLVQYAALRLPSAKVMAYTYLTPAWVILWEGGLGHGWPPLAILAGVALVVSGLLLLLKD